MLLALGLDVRSHELVRDLSKRPHGARLPPLIDRICPLLDLTKHLLGL